MKIHKKNNASNISGQEADEKTPLLISWRRASSVVHADDSKAYQIAQNSHDTFSDRKVYRSADYKENVKQKVSYFKTLMKCFWLDGLSSNWGMITYVITNIVSPFVLG